MVAELLHEDRRTDITKVEVAFSYFAKTPKNVNFFLPICVKTNKCTDYSFNLLIMCGSSYTFRHYIAILRERL
jgi:hypothetical protein